MGIYRKEYFAFNQDQPVPIIIRNYEERDFPGLIRVQQECFPPPLSHLNYGGAWSN